MYRNGRTKNTGLFKVLKGDFVHFRQKKIIIFSQFVIQS